MSLNSSGLPKILVLNSAQGKYPRGSDPWVQATVQALEQLAKEKVRVISSAGLRNWEITTYLAGRLGLEIVLIVPGPESGSGAGLYRKLLQDFLLDPHRTRPVYTGEGTLEQMWQARDRLALGLADTVCPVSIRPGGRLEELLECGRRPETRLRGDWRLKWSRVSWRPRYDFAALEPDPRLNRLGRGWLIHWTRACPGPWPGERPGEYYRDMLSRPGCYVRDAESTLARIASEGILRASSWKMPSGTRAVGFTALPPIEAVPLMRWRTRFARYSFEPFGVAVRREALEPLGAGPVRYLARGEKIPPRDNRLFFHSAGERGDWTVEQEWRFAGDLDLTRFSDSELALVTLDHASAGRIRNKCHSPWPVFPLFSPSTGSSKD